MSTFINSNIKIKSDNTPVDLKMEFKTLLLCTYKIQVKEKNSDQVLHDWSGSNADEGVDKYTLGPGSDNVGRTVWIFLSIMDQTGDGGAYELEAVFEQFSESSSVTTGANELTAGTNKVDYTLFINITD